MGTQSNFESATLELLRSLKRKKEAVQARHAEELSQIEREIEAVATTARLLRESENNPAPSAEAKTILPRDLQGKSARQACIEIAKLNSGIVRVADARDALIAAGILTKPKNAWGMVYTTLARSDDFEKGPGPGSFRFAPKGKPQEQSLLQ